MDIRFIARPAEGRAHPDGLAAHARRRLQHRLRHCGDRVAHVSVTIGDGASRLGFRDTYCVMRVQLRGAPAATVVDIGTDARDTIDRAADRVARLAEEQMRSVDSGRAPSTKEAALAA